LPDVDKEQDEQNPKFLITPQRNNFFSHFLCGYKKLSVTGEMAYSAKYQQE
jgi:hypothetical protein